MNRHLSPVVVVCLIGLGLWGRPAIAMDGQIDIAIDPAAGYLIGASGSYVVVSNVTMTAALSAIAVGSGVNDVTIDLNGHTLTGNGAGSAAQGIGGGGCARLTVFNGKIRDFNINGVTAGTEADIHGVSVSGCGEYGIVAGADSLVADCVAKGNNLHGTYAGIAVYEGSTVRNCVSNANIPTVADKESFGINARGAGCTLIGNTCRGNRGNGAASGVGIQAEVNSLIANNTCSNNLSGDSGFGGYGIVASPDSTIVHNTCSGNNGSVLGNGFGISALEGCAILNNTCNANKAGATSDGFGYGISSYGDSLIAGNLCRANGTAGADGSGIGIGAATGSIVRDNDCSNNRASGLGTAYGIFAATQCVVENNRGAGQGGGSVGYGVFVSGADNTIQRNSTAGNDTAGIRLEAGGNIVELNRMADTTGLSDAGGNTIGAGDLANVTY